MVSLQENKGREQRKVGRKEDTGRKDGRGRTKDGRKEGR
jgi:hypothetical protein